MRLPRISSRNSIARSSNAIMFRLVNGVGRSELNGCLRSKGGLNHRAHWLAASVFPDVDKPIDQCDQHAAAKDVSERHGDQVGKKTKDAYRTAGL